MRRKRGYAAVLRINELILGQLESRERFQAISTVLWEQIHHDFISISILRGGGATVRLQFLDVPAARERYRIGVDVPDTVVPFWPHGVVQACRFRPEQLRLPESEGLGRVLQENGIRAMYKVPLTSKGRTLGILCLGSRREGYFTPAILRLLALITPAMALALDNDLACREIRFLKDKLAEEALDPDEETSGAFAEGDIIGSSRSLKQVLHQVETVAPADSTVLLLGETGTGKELIARAIHEHSRRRAQAFVKLNCSAIPTGLMESELFGHERGAFTGAIQRKIGRFELANGGSLFLDEIGDLPLEVQPKLLRAIQEREFERLGSNQTIHVDVRLIAATHRDLARMVLEGEFRNDLFYRLNVFPIHVPPLRERKEDIPGLVRHFTQKYAKAMERRIERIPSAVMEKLVAWPWPGNIRELQNLIERSVILSQGAELHVPLPELEASPSLEVASSARTLEAVEREHILQALRECKGLVSGPQGAAARLGMKRTTLNYRMKKLGIPRRGSRIA